MASCRTSFVSILNNDDNPSFAVPSAPSFPQNHSTSSYSCPSDHRSRPESPSSQSPDCSHDYAAQSTSSYYPSYRQDAYAYHPSTALSASERRRSLASAPGSPSAQASLSGSRDQTKGLKKNKYPCPYAVSHGCSATFTTSGHAARHGKKHTGEKSVHCPVCNKAFTRKDNMKQHIRTHRTYSEDMPIERDGDLLTRVVRTNPAYHHHTHSRSISQTQVNGHFYPTGGTGPAGHHPTPFRS